MTRLYFSRITVRGVPRDPRPTLFIGSHRNGATDGQVYVHALGRTPSLISIQLLRKAFLRVLFDGIAVVREKDCQRYGLKRSAVASPVAAAVAQIHAGGDVCILPEGTSEWSFAPQDYQAGMAVIAAKCRAAGVDFVVQPMGVFYTKPDGFRSRVSVVRGKPFVPLADDVKALQTECAAALDAVSVDCRDVRQFNAVQRSAWRQAQQGADFGEAFLRAQRAEEKPAEFHATGESSWRKYLATVALILGFPMVMLAARLAQRGADGRNNVTFFRLLGGFYGAWLQIVCYLLLLIYLPWLAVLGLSVGLAGWWLYPEPQPLDLED
ncbi:hypothetical protein L0B52_03725 [Suttonella sp. R2A3]|uniref:hypothetical protein n=1 Tax=Suttonella sp. R2A3 TaxID=2908648 RepID=UPI001F1C72D2|nr:hypothetical protein [Suttonella sp. R2A3]UJF25270.1 hypothetical protein L0B52_03725 [Suttonella sp. R2A3]